MPSRGGCSFPPAPYIKILRRFAPQDNKRIAPLVTGECHSAPAKNLIHSLSVGDVGKYNETDFSDSLKGDLPYGKSPFRLIYEILLFTGSWRGAR